MPSRRSVSRLLSPSRATASASRSWLPRGNTASIVATDTERPPSRTLAMRAASRSRASFNRLEQKLLSRPRSAPTSASVKPSSSARARITSASSRPVTPRALMLRRRTDARAIAGEGRARRVTGTVSYLSSSATRTRLKPSSTSARPSSSTTAMGFKIPSRRIDSRSASIPTGVASRSRSKRRPRSPGGPLTQLLPLVGHAHTRAWIDDGNDSLRPPGGDLRRVALRPVRHLRLRAAEFA